MQPVSRSIRLLAGLVAFLVPIASAASTVRFEPAAPIAAAGGLVAATSADINRDGRPDLVLIEPVTGGFELVWLENGTAGWTRRLIATSASLAGLAVADLDRDGDLDVLASSPANSAIRWFANSGGDGTAWLPQTSITTTAGGITGIAVADIDGDGAQDVVGAVTGVGEVRFWRRNAASGLWQERPIGAGATGIAEIATADIDSDGRIDVVGLVPGVSQIRWWKNPPNPGTATSWTNQFVGNAGDPVGLAIVDFDADGAPDVLAASRDNAVVGLWTNPGLGQGGAWTRDNLGSFAEVASLTPVDLDRDGDFDVVLGRGGAAGELAWLENQRDAGMALRTIATPIDAASLVLVDDDLDGDPDLFAGASALLRLGNAALGRGAAFSFTNDQIFLPLIPFSASGAAVGRINDDARPDSLSIGVLPPEKSQAQVVLNLQGDSLGISLLPEFDFSIWPGPILPPRISGPAIADFDRDGRNELLFGSRDNGADFTTMGVCSNTAARFEDFPLWSCRELFADDGFGNAINASIETTPVAGDIDRDGLQDLVAGTRDWLPVVAGQRRLMWFEHLGDFTLSTPFEATEIALGEFSVIDLVDINNDGREDVVTDSALFRNDADDGSVWTRQDPLPFGWEIFATADLDRDAVVDLLAVTGLNQGLHWARRDGGLWQTFEIDADAQCPCTIGDMDRDGDQDVLALDENGAPLLLRNDLSRQAAAEWTRQILFPQGWQLPVSGLLPLDFSEDGLPELSVISEGIQYVFTGLAATLTAEWQPRPPAVLVEGEETLVFALEVAHAGAPGDPEVALTAMQFDVLPQFNESAQPLDAAQLELLVADLAVYRDDGNGLFDAGDTLLAARGSGPFAADEIALDLGPVRGDTRFACCDQPATLFVTFTAAPGAAAAFATARYLRPARLSAVDVVDQLPVSTQPGPLLRFAALDLVAPASTGQQWFSVTVTGSGSVESDPPAIVCDEDGGSGCSAQFADAGTVTLTAIEAGGQLFGGWEGDCGGLGACVVTMDRTRAVAARFVPPVEQGVVNVTPSAGGTITSDPPRLNCPGVCEAEFDLGAEITLIATPDPGAAFDRWFPIFCTAPEEPTCSFEVGPVQFVTVSFVAAPDPDRTLEVTTSGQGRVTSSPAGIDCGSTCTADFLNNTLVVLNADPEPGWRFVQWGGDCSGSDPSCPVSLSVDQQVDAVFEPEPVLHRVSVARIGSGRVRSMPTGIDCGAVCSVEFLDGTAISLNAQAAPGFSFDGWVGDVCSGTGVCSFTLTVPVELDAVFVSDTPSLPLTVTVTGNGRVRSQPFGIDCPGVCSAGFDAGSAVELLAEAAPGHVFTGWDNACSGSGACIVTMDAAREVEAVFTATAPRFELEVLRVGSGFVGSTPAGIDCGTNCLADFAQGTTVELFAAAASGWRFSHFSGACSGSGPCLVDMNADRQVTANFIEQLDLSVVIDGQGAVVSDPAGIDCGADCSAVYDRDTEVTLTAAPGPGWVLAEWIGAACPLAATCTFPMQQSRTVTARFEPVGDLLYRNGFE